MEKWFQSECFDDEVICWRLKREVSVEKTKKRKFTVGYHHGKLNYLPSNYQFPLTACFQLIENWLLGILFNNVIPLFNLSSKEVNHINNGMRLCNMMECFVSEVNRVSIDKVCWKYKMNDWDYMSAVNVWDNFQNDFNIKCMANIKRKKPHREHFTIAFHLQTYFIIQVMHSQKTKKSIIHNHSQYIINKILPYCLIPFTLINIIYLAWIDNLPLKIMQFAIDLGILITLSKRRR